jgi:hypothetical protein
MSIGEHKLSITFNKNLHRQLVIDVINDETNYLSKLKPFGPGLQRAIVDLPTEFYVHLNQQTITNNNYIQFCLEPSYQADIDYEQQMATVRYTPLKPGDCPIHILECNKDILHSPFIAHVKQEEILHDKPRLHVKGLAEQIVLHRPVEFQVRLNIWIFLFLIFLLKRFLSIIHLMIQHILFISKSSLMKILHLYRFIVVINHHIHVHLFLKH